MKWLRNLVLAFTIAGGGAYVGDSLNDDTEMSRYIDTLGTQVEQIYDQAIDAAVDIDSLDIGLLECDEEKLKELETALEFYEYMQKMKENLLRANTESELIQKADKIRERAFNKVQRLIKLCRE